MKPENLLKAIADAVKSKEELRGVVCRNADSRDFANNPSCSFTLCLGVGKTKLERSSDSSEPELLTELKLCLLAPKGAGGKRLFEVAQWIGEAINESVPVSTIEICEARFNEISSTLYSDIRVTVEEVSVAEKACNLYIDGKLCEGNVSFEAESQERIEKKGQLLNGYSFVKTGSDYYVIKLKTDKNLKNFKDGAQLKFSFGDFDEIYGGCRQSCSKRVLDKQGNLTFSFDITAESYEHSEKEVQDE